MPDDEGHEVRENSDATSSEEVTAATKAWIGKLNDAQASVKTCVETVIKIHGPKIVDATNNSNNWSHPCFTADEGENGGGPAARLLSLQEMVSNIGLLWELFLGLVIFPLCFQSAANGTGLDTLPPTCFETVVLGDGQLSPEENQKIIKEKVERLRTCVRYTTDENGHVYSTTSSPNGHKQNSTAVSLSLSVVVALPWNADIFKEVRRLDCYLKL